MKMGETAKLHNAVHQLPFYFLSFQVHHAKKNMITDPASLSYCCFLAQSHVKLTNSKAPGEDEFAADCCAASAPTTRMAAGRIAATVSRPDENRALREGDSQSC